MKYRKKPVVIEAVQFLKNWDAVQAVHALAEGSASTLVTYDGEIHVHTLEGVMVATPGDYIIRGVKDELYPCKPDIFEATYEPADT